MSRPLRYAVFIKMFEWPTLAGCRVVRWVALVPGYPTPQLMEKAFGVCDELTAYQKWVTYVARWGCETRDDAFLEAWKGAA